MKRRRTLAAGALTAMMLAATAGAAAAEPIEHAMFEESFSTQFDCGDGLILQIEGRDAVHFLLVARGPDGLLSGQAIVNGTTVYTNPANGKTFTTTYQFLDKDLKVTDNGDGTYNLVVMHSGQVASYGPDGSRLLMDAGMFVFNGVLDVANGEFVFGEDLRQAGRWDTDGRDFCSDMHEFLG
jgi:hypothetical protein